MPLQHAAFSPDISRIPDAVGGNTPGVSFRLLGPVGAWAGERHIPLGTPQQRAVLTMLVFHRGAVVTSQTLVDGVWGEEAPRRAQGTVRTYVSRLRAAFAEAEAGELVCAHGGYALRAPGATVDALLFEQETTGALRGDGGDPRADHDRLTGALGRWRGTALAGVPGPYAERQRDRLHEVRICAQEALFERALALGSHARSIPELHTLVAEFPLRERLHGLLMLALYRSGQQAEALSRYEEIRRMLARELGVGPTPHLAALHQRMLTADPSLSAPDRDPSLLPGLSDAPGAPGAAGAPRFPGTPGASTGAVRPGTPGGAPVEPGQGPGHRGHAPAADQVWGHTPWPPAPSSTARNGPAGQEWGPVGQDRSGLPGRGHGPTGPARGPVNRTDWPLNPGYRLPVPGHGPATGPTDPARNPDRGHRPTNPAHGPTDHEPGAGAEPGAWGTPFPGTPRPHRLPPAAADFTGRHAAVAELTAVLTGQRAPAGAPAGAAPRLVVVTGIGGVGKTTLAVQVAHALGEEFPDGRLHADLGAGSSPVDPGGVLADFLGALGTPAARIPFDLGQRAALFRTVLADRRVLLVLDNARDAEQIRPLLPGTASAAVVVTTRARQLTVPGAHRIDLEVPSGDESLELLGAIAGPGRVAGAPETARALVERCGRLPLAVRIVGSRLAAHPGRPLDRLAERLGDGPALLDELRSGELAVEPVFRLGYEALTPGDARAFRALALLDTPDLPLTVAAVLLDLDPYAAEAAAERLVDAGMLESYGPDRYRFHDLLRAYARRLAERTDGPGERDAARTRVLDLLLATVLRAARTAVAGELPTGWVVQGDHPGLPFSDVAEVRAWFTAEHAVLTSVVEQSLRRDGEELRKAMDLLVIVACCGLFPGRARYQEVNRIADLAVARTLDDGDAASRSRALHTRAWLRCTAARYTEAECDLRAALHFGAQEGNPTRLHVSGVLLALVLWAVGRAEEAVRVMREAEALAGDPEDPYSPASVARFTARLHVTLGSELPDLPLVTPLMREVDATGTSLVTDGGIRRLGDLMNRSAPPPR
ncbi:AfsR/SARP family transcriptional regulator [Streptomyces clavuligerus]|uniref:AfsR/SARP family transcriptional regulator n=1 Tax=Streptomyces clavuligerus TaxID=1901 RepID=UPI0018D03136|nr:AfsR/SARP family transcriptional regulator [Streptomyces clavuligerus]